VGIGDDELDAAQAAPGELPEERRPEGLGLGGSRQKARDLGRRPAVTPCRGPDAARRQPLLGSALPYFVAASMFPASGPTQ
jgi:hypothetical protein